MSKNVALRFSFQVPVMKGEKLAGMTRKNFVIHDCISVEDFREMLACDLNKLAELWESKVRNYMIAKHNVTPKWEHLVKRMGISSCHHEHATPVDPYSSAWI